MNDYFYIAIIIVIILTLSMSYFSERAAPNYGKAFQKTNDHRETTLYIFSAPCDRTKYSLYGTERDIRTNKGVGFPTNDYFDTKQYLSPKDRNELINRLLEEGWAEVTEITNSDGRTRNIGDMLKSFGDVEPNRCK